MDNETKKNVLFIAYLFPPRGGAGVQRSAKFAKYLPDFGYNPLVLTAENQDADFVRDERLLEELDGTTIYRCRGRERWLVTIPRKLRINRLVSFWSRPDIFRAAWLPAARRMALQIAKEEPISVIYTSLSPYSSALLGRQLRDLLGIPWIVDYRDPWTTSPSSVFPTKLHYGIESRQERNVLAAADAVVVVTPTMKAFLIEKYPECAEKIHVICNGFDSDDVQSSEISRSGPLRIGFAGSLLDHNVSRTNIGARGGRLDKLWSSLLAYHKGSCDYSTHSPFYLLQAVRALLDERPELSESLELSFAGTFGDANLQVVKELGLERVVSVKGYLSHKESTQLLMNSDVLFFPMMIPPEGCRSHIHAGKLFEYLATGKPILATVPEGDARDLIEEARAGWCVEPRDVGAIKARLEKAIEQKTTGTLKLDANHRCIERYERRELTHQLAALFDKVTA